MLYPKLGGVFLEAAAVARLLVASVAGHSRDAPANRIEGQAAVEQAIVIASREIRKDASAGARLPREGRGDEVALALREIAVGPSCLDRAGDAVAEAAFGAYRPGGVELGAVEPVAADLSGEAVMRPVKQRPTGDPVDHPAWRNRAVEDRRWALEDLDPLHIDKLIAEAVADDAEWTRCAVQQLRRLEAAHEEVGEVAITAIYARAEPHGLGEGGDALVVEQLARQDGDALRDIADWRIRPRRGRRACGTVCGNRAEGALARADHVDLG
jgi:hypothetical protein